MINLKSLAAACVFAGAALLSGSAFAEIREHNMKLAFQTNMDTSMGIGAAKFSELVKEKSGGKITVQLFPGGALGGDVQTIAAVRGGTIEATNLSAGLLVSVVKEFGLFDLPFLFQNDDEARAVVDGAFGKRLNDALAQNDLVGLGYWGVGFRHLTNNKHPVTKLEDVAGLKIRVLQSPIYVDMWNAMGANAVAMPFPEVYGALEQGTVDGQENPYATVASNKLYEVQKYLSETQHIYFVAALIFSKSVWDQLNDDERAILQEAAKEARDIWWAEAIKEREALAAKLKEHMTINPVAPQELARFRTAVQPVVDKYVSQANPDAAKELFEAIKSVRGSN